MMPSRTSQSFRGSFSGPPVDTERLGPPPLGESFAPGELLAWDIFMIRFAAGSALLRSQAVPGGAEEHGSQITRTSRRERSPEQPGRGRTQDQGHRAGDRLDEAANHRKTAEHGAGFGV